MKTIKIFLASSEELKDERKELADLVEHLNFTLNKQDLCIQLVKWEYLDSSMGPLHKQEEYNKELRDCELCMVLYWTRFGMYTKTELDTAYRELCAGNNPKKLYVYFKDGEEISSELKEFRDGFPEKYGHFFCHFQNVDTLKADFLLQFMEYLNVYLKDRNVIEIKDSQVSINGKVYVNLQNVPFAGNNEEYNLLLKSIKKTKKLLSVTEGNDPEYAEYVAELKELEEKQAQMESSLWDTALMVTRLSTTKCSERLQRAMELFGRGDNKGAQAILNEEEIEKDIQHNLHLIELGEEGKKGIQTNIEEYLLKIKMLKNEMPIGWMDKVLSIRLRILELRKIISGGDTLSIADAFDGLRESYDCKGDYKKALEYSLNAMEVRRQLLGEKHSGMAKSYNDVGYEYGQLGDHEKALEYELKSLYLSQELMGENHIDTISSYNNVGSQYGKLGNHKKALEYALTALELNKKLLGDHHLNTALFYNNAGYEYGELGNHKKALEFQQKALALRRDILGERHSDTGISYNNVGFQYGALGNHKKALEFKQKALNINIALLGEWNPITALSYNNVGHEYGQLGNHEKALEYGLTALEINKKLLGDHHPNTALCYSNVGYEYGQLGNHEKALEYGLTALELNKNFLGANHCQTAISYNNVGAEYHELGNYTKALEYKLKALSIVEVLGNEKYIATFCNRVARTYLANGNVIKAKEYFERASGAFQKCGLEEDYNNNLEELKKING